MLPIPISHRGIPDIWMSFKMNTATIWTGTYQSARPVEIMAPSRGDLFLQLIAHRLIQRVMNPEDSIIDRNDPAQQR